MQRISLERTWRYVLGAIVSLTLGLAFVGVFTALAIYNIFAHQAVIQSSLWLLLVASLSTVAVIEYGPIRIAIGFLGLLAHSQFIEAIEELDQSDTPTATPTRIAFGYQLLNRKLYYLKIDKDKIVSIDWSPGQVSDRSGQDANDWNVWVWYEVGDDAEKPTNGFRSNQENYAVGDSGSKQQAETLGRRVIALLHKAGANFTEVPGGNSTKFRRTAP